MFNVSYESAKIEVARRHEHLREAQRTGMAFEPRRRRTPVRLIVRRLFAVRPAATESAPASNEPCATC